jgi:hypothetical protein
MFSQWPVPLSSCRASTRRHRIPSAPRSLPSRQVADPAMPQSDQMLDTPSWGRRARRRLTPTRHHGGSRLRTTIGTFVTALRMASSDTVTRSAPCRQPSGLRGSPPVGFTGSLGLGQHQQGPLVRQSPSPPGSRARRRQGVCGRESRRRGRDGPRRWRKDSPLSAIRQFLADRARIGVLVRIMLAAAGLGRGDRTGQRLRREGAERQGVDQAAQLLPGITLASPQQLDTAVRPRRLDDVHQGVDCGGQSRASQQLRQPGVDPLQDRGLADRYGRRVVQQRSGVRSRAGTGSAPMTPPTSAPASAGRRSCTSSALQG